MVLFIIMVVVFIVADIIIRIVANKLKEKKTREERKSALAESLNIDYTHESKTLKRVEVENPRARILCVDDEPVILDSFRKILALDGYNVDTVETGQEALGLIQLHPYDFVFTDLKMPHMDGVEVTKSVKHLRPDIDLVIITGYATVETAVECMKYGAMDYVQKPFTESELLEFTKKLLVLREERIKQTIKPQVNITSLKSLNTSMKSGFSIPGGAFISKNHCWVSIDQAGKAKIGIDDFADKLFGKIDLIEFPNLGMDVKAGQVLFTVKLDSRNVVFTSPVSGKVVAINTRLKDNLDLFDLTPYHDNWICSIDAEKLHSELDKMKIGKAAVDFYISELEKLKELHEKIRVGNEKEDYKPVSDVDVGEMKKADPVTFNRYIDLFLG